MATRRIPRAVKGLVSVLLLLAPAAHAAISGRVRSLGSLGPIAGARVHLQADPASPVVFTAADGSFTLPVSPAGTVLVTAALPYDRTRADNYTIGGNWASDGDTGVEIFLQPIPGTSAPMYEPLVAAVSCGLCHGEQVEQWRRSNHAGAAGDTWVRDLHSGTGTPGGGAGYVFRATHDPGETGFCATCHTPMADVFSPGAVQLDEVAGAAALEGVSCVGCHQIDAVDGDVDALHHLGSSTYRFPFAADMETYLRIWGPLDDVAYDGMRAAYAPFFAEARFCASCHQYKNPTNGAPGQNTYGEWLASPYSVPGPTFRSCQHCHMPAASADGPICAVLPLDRPASQRHDHSFPGAGWPGFAGALELRAVAGERPRQVEVIAEIENVGVGHSFPTGISVRNAFLLVEARWNGMPLEQVGGPTVPWWADDEVPGRQPGDWSGFAGRGFAKVLEGRINEQGPLVRPVLFIDAERAAEDSLLPAKTTATSTFLFAVPAEARPGDSVEIEARLIYRRAWRALAVTKGWTVTPQGGPIETEIAAQRLDLALTAVGAGSVLEIPTLDRFGLVLLGAALLAAAYRLLSRRRAR